MAPAKLQVVMGKGGVGKTTVSAALALGHAEAGERVLLASLASRAELDLAIRQGWGPAPATLEVLELSPRALVDDVVAKLMPIPALGALVSGHPAYDAVYRIAPGVKELAILHRLHVLADQAPVDRIVVDGLATGHGTHFLEAPRKSQGLLAGRLQERAAELDRALTDPGRTQVLLATLLEEMPVRETVELAARLDAAGFPVEGIVANRVLDPLCPSPAALAALDALTLRDHAAEVGSDLGASWGAVQRMARAAAHLERRARAMEPLQRELSALGRPLARVPLLPSGEDRLRVVARRLQEAGL